MTRDELKEKSLQFKDNGPLSEYYKEFLATAEKAAESGYFTATASCPKQDMAHFVEYLRVMDFNVLGQLQSENSDEALMLVSWGITGWSK